jgi:hypothetical protein
MAFLAYACICVGHLFQYSQQSEMEFLDISLRKDLSVLLHAIQSLLLADLKKRNSSLVLKILTKKSLKQETWSLFMNSIL